MNQMRTHLKVLYVEDQERDVALLTRHFTRAGYEISSTRVDEEKDFRKALAEKEWDVILCDYSMPHFSALAALKIVRDLSIDIPFIIISGTVGETVAVEAIKAGAHDYLMKDNLARLVPAIEREIRDLENRQARIQAETQRGRLQAQLNDERERLDNIIAHVPGMVWESWRDEDAQAKHKDFVSDYVKKMIGYTAEECLAPGFWFTIIHPDDVERLKAETEKAFASGTSLRSEFRFINKDGQIVWAETHALAIVDDKGKLLGLRGVTIDISERKLFNEALQRAEEKYRSIFENAVEGIFQAAPDGQYLAVNPAMARILGYESPERLTQERIYFNPSNYVDQKARAELERILAEQDTVEGYECEVFKRDGTKISTIQNVRVVRDSNGEILWYEGSIEDVTNRRTLESQLRQSQKLEAVGMLAGGIAHDFNNLLTVIGGYCDLSLSSLPDSDPLYRNLVEVSKASHRAATLTRQLLAFSRKQVLQPRVLDLNVAVVEMEKLLRRLIGEDIEFKAILGKDLKSVRADPGQIEQVIMNLAVNSRDAMPNGGQLTIETANVYLDQDHARRHVSVVPGDYVMLAITDSGHGMDADTQLRIFEPFFTTKEQGKGTGLGLATVYGIVKQSGGSIWVYSEQGIGTTFKIYLPQVKESPHQGRSAEAAKTIKGAETILLAEDEELVRNLAREVLQGYGYSVIEAANGVQALQMSEQHAGEINLLLTDIVMPEMNGPELAVRLQQIRPSMKVLYMSGYTDNAVVHQGVLNQNHNFIQKPFSPIALAEKVRVVLDSSRKGPTG